MSTEQAVFSVDLAGIVVGETAISDVQGEQGLLSYRGIDINELVDIPFLHVVWLVIFGEWPTTAQKKKLVAFMTHHNRLTLNETALLQHISRDLHPMLLLQGILPLLSLPTEQSMDLDIDAEQGLFLAAKIPALLAAHYRLSQSKAPMSPVPGRRFHENF